jgi:hypothetical protein
MDATTGPLAGMAQSFGEAFTSLVGWALAWWVGGDDPDLAMLRANVTAIRPVSSWLAAVVLGVSVVVAAGVVMVRRSGADLAALVIGLARSALVISAGWLLLASSWSMSDGVSRWLLGSRPDIDAYEGAVSAAMSRLDPAIGLTLSIVGIASCLGFVAAVLARFVIAVLLSVGLPAMAALTVVRGAATMRLGLSWVVAVMAFKPLNAIVYRVGHGLVSSTEDPVMVLLAVSLTFLLAAALLPGVARLASGLAPVVITR